MSWGNRLLIVFIAFTGLMSYMTYRCVQTPVELVNREYYRDELVYQDVIDGTRNANALSRNISIYQKSGKIIIDFPPEMKNSLLSGDILFYHAVSEIRDRKIPLHIDGSGAMELDAKLTGPGQFIVKINWKARNKNYYSEQHITVL